MIHNYAGMEVNTQEQVGSYIAYKY